MTPQIWKKVKLLFNRVSELPEENRASFLAKYDDEIRREVEKMLLAVKAESPLLDEPLVSFRDCEISELPDQIGDYKIVREIGGGGMGTVYEAFRETENFRQRVALKVIRRGMNNDVISRRFRSEQKILASLEHPHIGRFLDGGKTGEGRPFYAMEYIEGRPIDVYCREERLSVAEKISLFRQVCAAVAYAHQNLIVHRDLKPSNILVNGDGTPKLLDFGIAKFLDLNSGGRGTATQFGMMTPQYASPEQIRGETATTLGDVYSLGIILFEILTGRKPYVTDDRSFAQIIEIICTAVPPKPSETLGSKIKNNNLKGDLDTIALKALQKEVGRRYQSVEQLSEDLRRHLEGLPITARPDTFQYRLGKFLARNKIAAAAGILIFLSLVTGLSVAWRQTYRAEKQRALAEKRFAEVRKIANTLVFKYHDEISKLNGSTAVREMLVRDAAAYLDNLAADSENDPALEHELGLACLRLGDVAGGIHLANVGKTDEALASYRKAVSLLERAAAADPDDIAIKNDLFKALDLLVSLMARTTCSPPEKTISPDEQATGRVACSPQEKMFLLDKSAKILNEILEVEPRGKERLIQLVTLYIGYGDSVGDIGSRDFLLEKLKYHEKTLPLADELTRIDSGDPDIVKTVFIISQRIGTDYFWLGENAELAGRTDESAAYFQKALVYHRKMIETMENFAALKPDDSKLKRNRIAAYVSYAASLSRNEKVVEALELSEKALNLAEILQAEDPANKETALDTARIYELFAKIYRQQSEQRKSAEFYERSLRAAEKIYDADGGNLAARNLIKTSRAALNKNP